MFTDTITDKILGKRNKSFSCDNAFQKPQNGKGLGKGLMMGEGQGPLNKQQFKHSFNPLRQAHGQTDVSRVIQQTLDNAPEISKATGHLVITFKNGKTAKLNISYEE